MKTIEDLLGAWRDAEARGDAAALDALLAADFRGDGPLGFVLDKDRWLDRYRRGELTVEAFGWTADDLRVTGDTAVAIGTQSRIGRYRGQDCSGAFACTLVAVRRDGRWTIVNLQVCYQASRAGHVWWWPAGRCSVGTRAPGFGQTPEEEQIMATNEGQPQQESQPPAPDPALKLLDRFVGTWDMQGRTLDSDVDNVTGRTTFEWLPGGYFLQQRITLDFAGFGVEGLEVISYDPATGTFPSTVYPNLAGTPIPYRWEIHGDELTITTELLGATFRGRWSEDGTRFAGGWRADPGREGPGNIEYDISGGRAKAES